MWVCFLKPVWFKNRLPLTFESFNFKIRFFQLWSGFNRCSIPIWVCFLKPVWFKNRFPLTFESFSFQIRLFQLWSGFNRCSIPIWVCFLKPVWFKNRLPLTFESFSFQIRFFPANPPLRNFILRLVLEWSTSKFFSFSQMFILLKMIPVTLHG